MSRSRGGSALRVADAVPVFAALGDATRLRLVGRLATEGPLSMTRLTEGEGVTRQAIARHLYALDSAGLVRHTRKGRERMWQLELQRLDEARRWLDQVSAEWDRAAERLKAFVEGD